MKHLLRPFGFCLYVFTLVVHTGVGQPPDIRFQHLTVDEGLSASSVYAITQDKHGYIWLGTTDGLNRFDGYTVEVFRHIPGDRNSLPDNAIVSLFTDSRGIVWIGTANGGVAWYDDHTHSFRSFQHNPKDNHSIPGNIINTIHEDNRGLMWIGTNKGLCSYDIRTNRIQRFLPGKHAHSISDERIRDIKVAPDGTLWIATLMALNRLDPATMRFTSFFQEQFDSTTLPRNPRVRIAIDKAGNLWRGYILSNKLYLDCFDTKTYRSKRFVKSLEKPAAGPGSYLISHFSAENSLNSLMIDKNGRLWIGSTRSGLILFLPDRDVIYEYNQVDPLNPSGLRSNTISYSLYQDRSGMIWFGTISGAERFNPDESKFLLYRSPSVTSFSLDQKSVQALAEDASHRLWVGTSDGLAILDRRTGKFTHHHWSANDTQALSENFITALCRDGQGAMWVGTMNGLKMYDPAQKSYRTFYTEKNDHSLAGNQITSMVCSKNGDLLIASRIGGLSIYQAKTRRFRNFKNSVPGMANVQINVVFEDQRGILWMGTRGHGLFRYDRASGKLENFTKAFDDTTSLPANYVGSITQDHNGLIWVGTRSGLSRFNENTRSFTTFTDKHGLPNVRVRQLLVDDQNRIWMGSSRGISMFNEKRTTFTNYDPSDGLQGWEFSEPYAFKTHDGYFCYGGSNGFNMFHPDSIRRNLVPPEITLRRISIFDQPLARDSSYAYLKTLRLSYKQNFFSFEFAALNYDHPEKNRYACQLIGFDKRLVQLGTNRVVSYTNVPPGHYRLKVMASNNDGVWNEAGYELALIIAPPFWATTWFRLLVIASFIGAVFLFFKVRENRIRKEQSLQTAINKQIAELKMTALRAQMNPHFIFNSLNAIKHLIAVQQKEEAINYLSKFSKLIRKILENSRENTVTLSNELELLELYIQLEQLRFSNKFNYHIEVDEKVDKENTEIPPLLIQPYIENAILHGLTNKEGKGDLWLSLNRVNGWLVCKIEDNGVGRVRAPVLEQRNVLKHKPLGMQVTSERITAFSALLDYKVEVEVEDLCETNPVSGEVPQPGGTRVTITIPVREEE